MKDLNVDYMIRFALPEDASIIARHRAWMFRDMGSVNEAECQQLLEVSTPWLASVLKSGEYVGWLVEYEREIVAGGGILLMDLGPRPGWFRMGRGGHIVNVYTEVAHRRRGLARKLVQEILAWCAEQKLDQVTLAASDEGRPLYESLGFVATNDMRLARPSAG